MKTKISIAGFLGTSALNDVLQTGFYVQTINSNDTPENNYPVAIAGLLEVFRYNDMWIFQRYTTYQNKMYIRSKYSSTFWETWTNIN